VSGNKNLSKDGISFTTRPKVVDVLPSLFEATKVTEKKPTLFVCPEMYPPPVTVNPSGKPTALIVAPSDALTVAL
jgi:hypothetical protein